MDAREDRRQVRRGNPGTIVLRAMDSAGTAEPAPRWALVRVADEGQRIPEGDMSHVFECYRRAIGRVSRARGSGPGLYTSRTIAEARGGVSGSSAPRSCRVMGAAAAPSAPTAGRWHGTVVLLALPTPRTV